jgi:RND family efflux transporter MFP subunit
MIILCLLFLAAGTTGGVFAARSFWPNTAELPKTETEKKSEEGGNIVTLSKEKRETAGIETTSVAAKTFNCMVWRTGRVALNEDRVAHLSPPAEGIVREVPVRLGQNVSAGDVLAVIDCRELGFLKLELVKARVALATERENMARILTTTTNAGEMLKLLSAETPLAAIEKQMANKPIGDWRSQLLGAYTKRNQLRAQLVSQKSTSGSIPETTIRKTEADVDAAEAAYTALMEELRYQIKSLVRQAELKLREAETSVDVMKAKLLTFGLTQEMAETVDPIAEGAKATLLTVKAPFSGTIVEKHAVLSERVGPQFQMFILSDLSSVWVQADVFETDLPLVRGLANKTIAFRSTLSNIPDQRAKVVYTGDLIDKSSRTLTLTAEAANSERTLKPGMFVEIGFDAGDETPVVQLPVSAILRYENKTFVFVATGDDTFERRDVLLGRTAGDAVEIVTGLNLGDSVVTRGAFVLKSELLKDKMVGE